MITVALVCGWISGGQAKQDENGDLIGIISKDQLLEQPYANWYNESNQAYTVDESSLAALDALLDGVTVKVIMGTWCHDSKSEVPRFYKILSRTGVNQNAVELIAVDRNKQFTTGEIEGLDLTNTPTFIFYKNGKEINRIVETPVESFEKDMMKIFSGSDYRHSKMPAEE